MNVLAYPHVERAWPEDDSDLTLTFTVDGRPVPYLHGLVIPGRLHRRGPAVHRVSGRSVP